MSKKIVLVMVLAPVVLFLICKPVADAVNNLVWLFSQPALPKDQFPFGIFSTPGGGLLMLFTLCIPLILYAAFSYSRRG